MTAEEIRNLTRDAIGTKPADAEDLAVLLLGEIAAQLAELNARIDLNASESVRHMVHIVRHTP